ncbi:MULTISPECIES: NapC/NirT family cytochrome c [Ectothiorhodospira]|uniref:NapC/NirT family cytochrome c n=1 Tax=Ectothiorhodospira TaxID=1051 RepID=UPI001EE9688A|nr:MULTISPECIES: NapC/NirT family cytochrome c [Ectothiorhodospira]MCG5495080.1 NapC/NirT family cytochrome c [Ectothiorhodospira variabilis]MCG5498621.1 NapC/NirT family cytochrome c [Ectothiorhodospira variabilis]MCG5504667.1 NapC/NirT family cytochrome c [Ectothiorhodospira variabilis]MCG5507780.1 NapC/NirT family cytochrome c [Ectothiorhodospira variabilis]MCG5525704.1 NapC/NirT family cytochrome c [Ectothiorhodospira haloalkaliphila]
MSKIGVATILVLVLVLVVGGGAGHQVTTTDAFCSSCHAYEKVSWDQGQHPEVGCLDCHTGGFMHDKIQGARKVYRVFTGQVDPHHDPLPSYPEKTHGNCVACHLNEAVVEYHPIFAARHERYMEAAEFCMACHESGHVLSVRAQRDR